MNDNEKLLILHILSECMKNGIKVILDPNEKTNAVFDKPQSIPVMCSGFFDQYSKLLCVAMKSEWQGVLAHEFSHSCQAAEGKWIIPLENRANDPWDNWDDFLNGKEFRNIEEITRHIQECELDCEKRTFKLLKQFNLLTPEEEKIYIKKANCYVLFYQVALKHRKWSNKSAPYANPEIYNLMPSTWILSLTGYPKEFEDRIVEMCFEEKKEVVNV